MEDRATTVRNYILDMIESGDISGGDKLPAAREIASKMGFSLITVQNAIDGLVKEGILVTLSRRGTFVHIDWKTRVLQTNITLFRNLPWEERFKGEVKKILPQCRVCSAFDESVFEVRTTQYVQSHHDEYMDLSEIFEECVEDKSDIIMTPFKSFYVGEKLAGLPIIYSPRVMFYNPELLHKAGCIEPYSGWSWGEFIECIHKLKNIIPGKFAFEWHNELFLVVNFVVRAGGSFLDFNREDPVTMDSTETRNGLKLFRELRHILEVTPKRNDGKFVEKFTSGEAGMFIDAREALAQIKASGFTNWKTVNLPRIPGGKDLNVQATDLFCVRKSCVDIDAARKLAKLFFSREFQEHMAELSYGIPIRKSATAKAIDYDNPADMLFLSESAKMYSSYNLDSVDLYDLVSERIRDLVSGEEDIDEATRELASMVRTYIKLKEKIRKTA